MPALLEQAIDPVMVEWTTVPVPSSEETARAVRDRGHPGRLGARAQAGPSRSRPWTTTGRRGSAAPSSCATRATAGPRSRTARTRGRAAAGLMERACRLLLDWGFATQRLETVIWWANQGNWASRKLAWRLGFACRRDRPAAGCRSAASCSTPGSVCCCAATRGTPATPWFDVPRIDGRARDAARATATTTSPGSSRRAATSRPPTGCRGCRSPYTREDALAYLEARRERLRQRARRSPGR